MVKRSSAFWQTLFKLAVLLVGSTVIGFLLLLGVYAIPVERIARNVQLSVPALDDSWATGEIAYEQLVKGYLSTQLDNSTDANMMLAAAHDRDRSIVQMAVNPATYTLDGRCYPALLQFGQSGSAGLTSNPIARYWHGYLVVLKPLLYFFSYMDIRVLLMVAEWLLVCAVLAGFAKRGLYRFIPAFALSLVVIMPSVAGFSLQFSTVYLLMLGLSLTLLYRPAILHKRGGTAIFFMVAGMLTSYFDYLTYPIATFGVPFVIALLLQPTVSLKEALQRFLLALIAWLTGYFGLWAGKWLIAILLGEDSWFLANLLAKITERSAYAAEGATLSLLSVFQSVFGIFAKKAYLTLGICVVIFFGAWLLRIHRRRRHPAMLNSHVTDWRQPFHTGEVIAMVLTALLPLVWYAFTSNHTYDHAFFTSRALVVTAFAGLSLCTRLLEAVTADALQNGNPTVHP